MVARSIAMTAARAPGAGLAILGANTFTGVQLYPAGSAALPSVAIGQADLGLYQYSSGILGIAASGKSLALFDYRLINSVDDNATLTLGVPNQVIANTANDTYPTTINFQPLTITGNSNVIANSFGDLTLTATDTVTKAKSNGVLEMDKIDLYQTGGAVTFGYLFNTRFRTVIPHTSVTVTDAVGITFVLPSPSDVTGTVTNVIAIDIPPWAAGGATNYYGMRFNNNPAGGSIVSADGTDLSLKASVGGSANGTLYLDGRGSSGRVNIQTNDRDVVKFETVSATLNFLRIFANSTPTILAGHLSTADVDLALSSKGIGSLTFLTGGAVSEQVRVTHTASASRYLTLTGSNGGNPGIGASAGAVAFTSELITLASATGTAGFNLPHGAAPTSPINGDMWTTTAGVFIRINGVTKTFTTT